MSLVGEPYDACSGGVVGLSLMTWTTLMIRPQAPKCSRPFQLNLLFWGIVPCASKIDTLGLFHSLLKEKFAGYNAGRAVGGGAHAR